MLVISVLNTLREKNSPTSRVNDMCKMIRHN